MLSLFSHFKQRALLWSFQQFFSEGVDVKGYARSALYGVVAAAAAGVLIALSIAAGLGALYFFLTTQQGYDIPTALIFVALSALLPAGALFWLAKATLSDVRKFSTPAPLKAPVGVDHLTSMTGDVINGFVEGLLKPKPRARIVRFPKTVNATTTTSPEDRYRKSYQTVR